MQQELTDQVYWESYYKHSHANKKHITAVCSKFDSFWDELFHNQSVQDKTLIEIGGYPGRYLAYLSSTYGVKPTCLDFNSDSKQIEAVFQVMGVKDYTLIQHDFLKHETKTTYDYIISLGFIEHFENFDAVLDKHLEYLKPGGRLLVKIPNKRYLRKYYGLLCDYKNLKAHNLKCMNLQVFKDFASRNNLETIRLHYYGGFPFGVHQKQNLFQKLIYKTFRWVFKGRINSYLLKHPSKYLSASIIAIYEKPM